MEDVFVGQLMSTPIQTVTSDTTVQQAAKKLADNDIGSVIVVDGDNQLEGILTTTDFVHLCAEGDNPTETSVQAIMSTDVQTTTARDLIRDVADTMLESGVHHVPVVEAENGVIGMITTTDLTAYLSHVQSPSPAHSR